MRTRTRATAPAVAAAAPALLLALLLAGCGGGGADDGAGAGATTDDGAPAAGDGVDAALLGTTERTDGGVQVTYDGWPLYYWAQDDAPGDATGQGVNDVWWVLDASGEPIRD